MATIEKNPPSDIALMIDIETLSLRPDAFVTQVGYCVANTRTREYLVQPTNYFLGDISQEGRHKDFDTIRWWMKQDPKVQASVFAVDDRKGPSPLFMHLQRLVETHAATVWASPAMFDLAILTSLWEGKKPWKYNAERDMMTLYKLLDPTGALQPPNNSMGHDAAADAAWQMEYLFKLLDRVRALEDAAFRMEGLDK